MGLAALALAAGCGRVAFDARTDAAGSPDSAPADAHPADLLPGLLLWYPLDDTSFDGSAADMSGGNRPALCSGVMCPSPAAGRVGGAALLDGVDDHLRTPYDPVFATNTGFTLAAWFWLSSYSPWQSIMAKPLGTATNNSWQIEFPDVYELRLKNGTLAGGTSINGGVVSVATWVHVVGTWDGGQRRIYVDGALRATSGFATVDWDAGDLFVGADLNNAAVGEHFPGLIDDVRLYDRPLTPAEIQLLVTR